MEGVVTLTCFLLCPHQQHLTSAMYLFQPIQRDKEIAPNVWRRQRR